MKKMIRVAMILGLVALLSVSALAVPRMADPPIAVCESAVEVDASVHTFTVICTDYRGRRLCETTAELRTGTEVYVPVGLPGYRIVDVNACTNAREMGEDFPRLVGSELTGVMPDGDVTVYVSYAPLRRRGACVPKPTVVEVPIIAP